MLSLIYGKASKSNASIDLGLGVSSATSGRLVPSLSGGINWESWTLSGFTTGVKTQTYYHSAYQLGVYKTWTAGQWIWGDIKGGFGLAGYFAERGYTPINSVKSSQDKDYLAGPAMRVEWSLLGPVFLRLEALFGLSHSNIHKYLSTRDMVNMSLGWRI